MIVRKTFPQVYVLEHPKTGGKYWLCSARSARWGMNERKTFTNEADALDHARQIEKSMLANGKQTNIPKEKLACIVAYENLVNRLTPFGKQPEEAVDYFLKYLGNEILRQAVPPINDLADKWKTFKYADTTLSHKTKIEIRSYARFIKNKWGDLKPDEPKKNDIDILLKKLNVSNNTRTKYLRYIRMFFGWVKDEHFISANPTDEIFYKRDGFNGDFYRPSVVADLLRHVITDHKDMVGYYSMLTFCGVRPSEGARIQWQDLDLKTKQLYVRKGKTQARYVNLEPVAVTWLKYHRKNTLQGKPFIEPKNLQNREKAVRKFMNGKWLQDGLRHGFGTYFKALTQNIEKVADTMGNSVTVVKRHYARAVPDDECKVFWNLTPKKVLAKKTARKAKNKNVNFASESETKLLSTELEIAV